MGARLMLEGTTQHESKDEGNPAVSSASTEAQENTSIKGEIAINYLWRCIQIFKKENTIYNSAKDNAFKMIANMLLSNFGIQLRKNYLSELDSENKIVTDKVKSADELSLLKNKILPKFLEMSETEKDDFFKKIDAIKSSGSKIYDTKAKIADHKKAQTFFYHQIDLPEEIRPASCNYSSTENIKDFVDNAIKLSANEPSANNTNITEQEEKLPDSNGRITTIDQALAFFKENNAEISHPIFEKKINAAYNKILMKCHPDRHNDQASQKKLNDLKDASSTLGSHVAKDKHNLIQKLEGKIINNVTISEIDVSDSKFNGYDFNNFKFLKSDLSGCTFHQNNIIKGEFTESDLTRTSFGKSNLKNVSFKNCTFKDTYFTSATGWNVRFSLQSIKNANFEDATFSDVTIDLEEKESIHSMPLDFLQAVLRGNPVRNQSLVDDFAKSLIDSFSASNDSNEEKTVDIILSDEIYTKMNLRENIKNRIYAHFINNPNNNRLNQYAGIILDEIDLSTVSQEQFNALIKHEAFSNTFLSNFIKIYNALYDGRSALLFGKGVRRTFNTIDDVFAVITPDTVDSLTCKAFELTKNYLKTKNDDLAKNSALVKEIYQHSFANSGFFARSRALLPNPAGFFQLSLRSNQDVASALETHNVTDLAGNTRSGKIYNALR